jgi:hypothetical protein
MGLGGHIAEQQYSAMNVRFGSKADVELRSPNVRLGPKEDTSPVGHNILPAPV